MRQAMWAIQPGEHVPAGVEYLPAEPGAVLWGRLPCAADAPVLTVDSGAEVVIDTLSHEGVLEDQGRDPLAFFGRHGVTPEGVLRDAVALAAEGPFRHQDDGPHVVTGPIAVRGAEPGDLLRMTLLEAESRVPYGVVSNRHNRGALPGEYPLQEGSFSVFARMDEDDAGVQRGVIPLVPGGRRAARFALRPFLGIMGVAVGGRERPHSVPPGPHGGNIDIALLTEGTSLYLPVQVSGALAYVGDPHFAQGNGEVALTAMEASLRVRVRFEVVPRAQALAEFGEIVGPMGETDEFLVPTGLDEDLDVAVQKCVRAAIALLVARFGMDPAHAYAYLSAATDFDISQVVDLVKGVHARVRMADFDV
ncbi:acetamidase/formamidase family protein [Rathayibacter iranicus]|uniref:Acetamidase n=2 Tax=Rathayibacter iranicus TaxID=59737 RepID=A0AAD1ADF6_9MICO|nr:acetamidase/formamidase family protein [Rathayibacter iranicus]AZZ55387.1 acetamidase [Rathayibacter iranicus]MWV30878.1 acetamidase [Rathayibacter iranicus NCPPB 2253 = VKM Ac-1602]PPI48175.1 acetamidase [Rathayibacter iranicus]PPI61391.1 acetamidase [Rathayibacter iranicus]PPI72665.1 acetamidase [Rathayibacter iranicus]